jgi:hypothetical protein
MGGALVRSAGASSAMLSGTSGTISLNGKSAIDGLGGWFN